MQTPLQTAWAEFKATHAQFKTGMAVCYCCAYPKEIDQMEEINDRLLCNTCADTARERASFHAAGNE